MKPQSNATVPSGGVDRANALLERVRSCGLCSDLPLGPRPILQFDPAARILLASQAPGRKAHISGVPFDDASGERLRNWLGVSRAQFYDPALFAIVPLGMCYPGTGPQGDFAPKPICARTWRPDILAGLRAVELTVAIGRHAMEWHSPGTRCASMAEAIRAADGAEAILPHPSPRNNRWLKANPWFENEVVPQLQDRIANLLR